MRKLFVALLLAPLFSLSQKLEEDKIDDFTKTSVKRTSYEVAVQNMKMNLFLRVSKLDNYIYLDIKYMRNPYKKYMIINQGMKIMIMLSNDSIVSLSCIETAHSCTGCGAKGFSGSGSMGIAASYVIFEDNFSLLKKFPIKKIRIYTVDGYVESEVNDKRNVVLNELLPLVE